MSCPWKIRPFPGPTEITCEEETAVHSQHEAVLRDYAWPGSETIISWYPGDRREFTGDYPGLCPEVCVLPAGHPGRHAP